MFKQRVKKILDQMTLDFLASIDHYRRQVPDVQLFYNFMVEETYDTSDLTFFLFMRSLAEQELNV